MRGLNPPFQTPAELRLFDQMPAGLAVYDLTGSLVHANRHFSQLVSCDSLPSRSCGSTGRWQGFASGGGALDPADFPCERALRGEIVVPGVALLHCDHAGVGRWLSVSASPIRDPAANRIVGVVLLFVGGQNNIAVSAPTAARSPFEQFAENSGNAIWIADAATERFNYRNPGHLALACGGGAAVSQLSEWLDRIDEDDRRLVRQNYEDVRLGETRHFEYRVRCADGTLCKFHETSFPIRDEGGAIAMLGGIVEDITPAGGATVYLVTGDPAAARTMIAAFAQRAKAVKAFASIRQLLDVADVLSRGCVVVDLATLAQADADLGRVLADRILQMPVVVIGGADTPLAVAVATMRSGAADYIVPPFSGEALVGAILRASARTAEPVVRASAPANEPDRLARLSKRERQVLTGLSAGGTNKSIARDLGISPRTVELHRSHLMDRMNARSLAELVRLAHWAPGGAGFG